VVTSKYCFIDWTVLSLFILCVIDTQMITQCMLASHNRPTYMVYHSGWSIDMYVLLVVVALVEKDVIVSLTRSE